MFPPKCPAEERADILKRREIINKSYIASASVCGPQCIFGTTCNKTGQKILDCDIVKKNEPVGGWKS